MLLNIDLLNVTLVENQLLYNTERLGGLPPSLNREFQNRLALFFWGFFVFFFFSLLSVPKYMLLNFMRESCFYTFKYYLFS